MLALMVGYTIVSLWILSSPWSRAPPWAPPGRSRTASRWRLEFKELCLDLDAGDRITYAFQSDRPVDFDIHYHDASFVHYPVELKHIVKIERSFVAELVPVLLSHVVQHGLRGKRPDLQGHRP